MPYEGKARSAMFSRRQSGGVFVIDDAMRHPGNVFFVDSGQTTTGGDTVGHGRNPDAPFLTIDYAVGQCVASNCDVIYVLPGHAEVVSAAAGLALDVIGISVIGCGNGSLQPTITFDTDADADMERNDRSRSVRRRRIQRAAWGKRLHADATNGDNIHPKCTQ